MAWLGAFLPAYAGTGQSSFTHSRFERAIKENIQSFFEDPDHRADTTMAQAIALNALSEDERTRCYMDFINDLDAFTSYRQGSAMKARVAAFCALPQSQRTVNRYDAIVARINAMEIEYHYVWAMFQQATAFESLSEEDRIISRYEQFTRNPRRVANHTNQGIRLLAKAVAFGSLSESDRTVECYEKFCAEVDAGKGGKPELVRHIECEVKAFESLPQNLRSIQYYKALKLKTAKLCNAGVFFARGKAALVEAYAALPDTVRGCEDLNINAAHHGGASNSSQAVLKSPKDAKTRRAEMSARGVALLRLRHTPKDYEDFATEVHSLFTDSKEYVEMIEELSSLGDGSIRLLIPKHIRCGQVRNAIESTPLSQQTQVPRSGYENLAPPTSTRRETSRGGRG